MVQPWDKQYQYLLFAAEPYESLLSRTVLQSKASGLNKMWSSTTTQPTGGSPPNHPPLPPQEHMMSGPPPPMGGPPQPMGSLPLQDLLKHGAAPTPDKQVPPFADSSSQVSKTPTKMRAAAWKKPGVCAKPPQKKLL
ncbi:unnamed protein product [Sphagnum jensenii]|uniref:Uncharacterized protein n=1 Tax=Sphagnum jensenii TaxID=128206 RepID=A0ABP0XE00_9BRYO